MKLKLYSLSNTSTKEVQLPEQFEEAVRPDLIQRAVLVLQSRRRQPYGAFPEAGKRHSAYLSKRRRDYRGTYGIGQSRTPRKIVSRRGTRINYVGAFAPQTVGGRRAHPPKAEKIWERKINQKENRKAIRSAMAASIIKDLVKARGHIIPNNYPFIIEDKIEELNKTKQLKETLNKLGFDKEIERAAKKTIRPGRGTFRGRKHQKKKSLLIVVSKDCDLNKAAMNLPGVEVVEVNALNAGLLAPGCSIARATLYTESAIKRLESERLFTKNYRGQRAEKEAKKEAPPKANKTLKQDKKKEKIEKKTEKKQKKKTEKATIAAQSAENGEEA